MHRNVTAVMALCALLVACRPGATPGVAPDGTSATVTTAGGQTGATDTSEGNARPATPMPGASADAPAETPDATLQALYASFEPPTRGDPKAPVLLYEFSDYL